MHDVLQLWMSNAGRVTPDGDDTLNGGIEQAFAEDALANHSGSAKDQHAHDEW
jgi:hypothetical protein